VTNKDKMSAVFFLAGLGASFCLGFHFGLWEAICAAVVFLALKGKD